MNKKNLLKLFEDQISASIAVLVQSAKEAHAAATHVENKPEDEYDTRGLEASYLAGAQSRRALELEELLNIYKFVDILTFTKTTPIASTAVIELQAEDGNHKWCLMMPQGGGMHVEFEGKRIDVITPQSPLGSAVLGKLVGEQVTVEIQNVQKDFDILSVQ